ncbi:TetR family transcriptional regulator [Marinitenerispora sediminis]|uniref:TetR family transcriptional regulator n=2 Tax=Marinitenerispora sediminis TaxID=1931232 RepID=A0A368TAB3_9ACTN|nr:TetR/AcrR family transcriptional regulator [Marinitenerispora sediminis]RCV53974.1 TetR family transcriptional regulator [Marinitenerispora sediminis]RCV60475.1 TetR family transcriptional regulator [Marinitenerispora sediminis]RCV61844.1 TetR family transcriptional regulator [Marinitenerispora sediminis]
MMTDGVEDGTGRVPVPGRRRRAGGARRQRALEAAARVLAERGYERTRFSDVAKEAGVAVSTLQTYFGAREDMVIEALYSSTEAEAAALEAAAAGLEDPWQRVVALLDRGMAPVPTQVWRMLLECWHASAHDPELAAHSAGLQERYRRPFVGAVDDGVARGVFRTRWPTTHIVTSLVAILDGLIIPRVLDHSYFDHAGVRDVIIAQAAALLGVDETAGHAADAAGPPAEGRGSAEVGGTAPARGTPTTS